MVDVARHIDIVKILETSPSVVLLRTRACHIIVEFLTSIFDESMVVSYENIHSRLADFLNDNNVEIDEENDILFSDTYEEKAVKYIKKWTDSGFLTNYRNEDLLHFFSKIIMSFLLKVGTKPCITYCTASLKRTGYPSILKMYICLH